MLPEPRLGAAGFGFQAAPQTSCYRNKTISIFIPIAIPAQSSNRCKNFRLFISRPPNIDRPGRLSNHRTNMSFRFNIDLSLSFPPPPPRHNQPNPLTSPTSPSQTNDQDGAEPKKGFKSWVQTARQHPQYNLRLLYFITCVIGLVLNSIAVNNIWSYRVNDVANGAFVFVRLSRIRILCCSQCAPL